MMREILTEIMPGVFAFGMLAVVCHLYGALSEVRKIITDILGMDNWAEVRTQWKMIREETD